ncbi:Mov34/MPN/PAD-1 family protein [Sinorhizobium meliloti]|uniref:Mov34/MPN/PAD-1 family protein n=2 Tax=Rhizobium meliloti TaxID=382 RepID=UPI00299CFBD1|nr:Mov34/MPN/PAD-1 family protein [Sinorhizobium meliloti]
MVPWRGSMSEDDLILFEGRKAEVAVRLSAQACRTIRDHALAAGGRETGGILIGRYDLSGNSAIVTEATVRPKDSRSGQTWFQRGIHGLKDTLRNRWSRGEYYVGEWHSHPGGPPTPSSNDLREMQTISREVSYRCPKPIMIIAGTSLAASVTLSVSVLENGSLIMLQRTLRNGAYLAESRQRYT